jgi:hypothetical protein
LLGSYDGVCDIEPGDDDGEKFGIAEGNKVGDGLGIALNGAVIVLMGSCYEKLMADL